MKKANPNTTLTSVDSQAQAPKRWHQAFFSVRTRLLLWYLFLAGCTAAISINTASRIYTESIVNRVNEGSSQQLDQFQVFVQQKRQSGKLSFTTSGVFDSFLNIYAPTRNEVLITLINGQLYQYRSYSDQSPALLQQRPDLMREWASSPQRSSGQIRLGDQRFLYMLQPFQLPGSQLGTLIVLYDASSDFEQGRAALAKLIRDVLVFLAISLIFAWVTAGRVLLPLRLVTKTAQSITDSDMSQRLPVQGRGEIAELTATFNEMLDRLQLAFDSQKEFLKDASHELRTPITVIQGHLEMLQYRPDKQDETLALVMDELDRMSRLVNDLLLLAKTENPDFLNLKPEELDWMTEELYLKSRSLADRQWRLESKGLSPIDCDRQRLTQAVMNLVQNAVRHTQPTDTITLGSAVRDNYAYLWVRDTGEGIALADQERIFERFSRATHLPEQPHEPSLFEGHGLGLSIVQAIAQAHHGWVELTSQLGQGASFTIVLPLQPPILLTADEPHSDRRRQSPHQFLPGDRAASKRI
jgi:signal transduction histidine kinase